MKAPKMETYNEKSSTDVLLGTLRKPFRTIIDQATLGDCFFSSEAYSKPCETSKMKRFAKMVYRKKPFTLFAKHSVLDV